MRRPLAPLCDSRAARQVLAWRTADQAVEGPLQPAATAALAELLPAPAAVEKATEPSARPSKTPDIRRFLRATSNAELAAARKMASLSAFAYFIPSVTVRAAARRLWHAHFPAGGLLAPAARAERPRRPRRSGRWPRATG